MVDLIRNEVAHEVLRYYPAMGAAPVLQRLGNRGGFSGVCLWQVHGAAASCLRAWPPNAISVERLKWMHQLMATARAAGHCFVPVVSSNLHGTTWVEHRGRLWELATWMPGRADFHADPTQQKMEAACTSLALVHRAWASLVPATGPCTGIQRRLERIGEWSALARHAGAAGFADIDKRVRPWAERAQILLSRLAQQVPSALLPLLQRSLPLQPCLCDVWHDHVLFTANEVTGLIDYGGVKIDHVAVDLARLLGSMAEDNLALVAAGLQAYMRVRPLSLEEQRLVGLLDRTGTIVGLANWLRWLCYERRAFEDYALVAQRMRRLIERMERWPANFLF